MTIRKTSAFTLLEMAIVVAIIGIIMGAVVAGKDFMDRAEMADAMAEVESLTIAYNAFVEQYSEIPGDFTRATSVWGARSTCPPANGAGFDGTNTCNGNGNRDQYFGTEAFLAVQHMSLAGLIPGKYTGASAIAGNAFASQPGLNVVAGALENSVLTPRAPIWDGNFQSNPADTFWWTGRYGPLFTFGSHQAGGHPEGAILTPEEAFKWDQKVDDALPASGRVVTYRRVFGWTNCITNNTQASTRYNVTYDGVACTLHTKVNP